MSAAPGFAWSAISWLAQRVLAAAVAVRVPVLPVFVCEPVPTAIDGPSVAPVLAMSPRSVSALPPVIAKLLVAFAAFRVLAANTPTSAELPSEVPMDGAVTVALVPNPVLASSSSALIGSAGSTPE